MSHTPTAAFPAKAGIQWDDYRRSAWVWVPAFAGKTVGDEGIVLTASLRAQRSNPGG